MTKSRILAVALVLAALALPVHAAGEESRSFSTDHLTVRNLIGEIRVEGHRGSDFDVVVRIAGQDAKAGLIRIETSDDELSLHFPDGQTEYVYPELDGDDSTRMDDNGDLGDLMGAERIRVRGSGRGLELWADVVVRVPRGLRLDVKHGIGQVVAVQVDGELELSTQSGDVHLANTSGRLAVATGSGDVTAERVNGEKIEIATGSGDVEAVDCNGEKIQIATGSGDIDLDAVRGRSVQAATGSGDVEIQRAEAENVSIGTGSGEVTLTLDRMGDGEFNVGTGSGDIALTLPSGASAEIRAETDQGEIRVDLNDRTAEFHVREDDEVELTVGGGAARVALGTGSGDIKISH